MSGHSKWANIKNRKGKADSIRGKIFTKIGRELAIAVKEGGSDPSSNGKLRDVIAKAKANNMPNDNITRSIKKAAGEMDGVSYEEITYEGYGPAGVAVIVEAVTDNRNRTAAEIRHIFDKYGNGMGATGCVSWMFDKRGVIVVERTASMDEDEVMMQVLDAGAEDLNALDDAFEILTAPNDFSVVREKIEGLGYEFLSAEVSMIPKNTVAISSEEAIAKVVRIIDFFDDNEDVQNVYHNGELPEEEDED